MKLERFVYLDASGIASLYSQLRGENVVETLMSMEDSRARGWKAALAAFIGGSMEATINSKTATTRKVALQPENMLTEITSNLRASGTLKHSLEEAISLAVASGEPSWFETRHPFSMPFQLAECNENRTAVFLSGFTRHGLPINGIPQIKMSASLNHFRGAYDGTLRVGGHDDLLFRSLAGAPYSYAVFGTLFRAGDGFQIKPYAIRT